MARYSQRYVAGRATAIVSLLPVRGWLVDNGAGIDAAAAAVPGIDRRSRSTPVLAVVEVDGRRFAVRRSAEGGTDYEELDGPDHGFGTSDPADRPHDAHVACLRESLRGFDAERE
jgi:hypothetical protein